MAGETVLVTGGSGFIAVYCILQLMHQGYAVRTTIRNEQRKSTIIDMLQAGNATNIDGLEFFIADLVKDEGWSEAVAGCTYVLHVASPLPAYEPEDQNEIIVPAKEGTIRVLKAARDAGVRRVVLTSSYNAIQYGHSPNPEVFTEEHWSVINGPGLRAYDKAKTIAERAAWDFIEKEGGSLELTAINPSMVFGPVLGKDYTVTILVVEKIVKGAYPACPQWEMGVVDVRDVADLHVQAMTAPQARGQRFICMSGEPMSMGQMAMILKKNLGGKRGSKISTRIMPNWVFWIIAQLNPEAKLVWPEIGLHRAYSTEKACKMLGWTPRSPEEAVIATGRSLFERGIITET